MIRKASIALIIIPLIILGQIRSDIVTDMTYLQNKYNLDNSYLMRTEYDLTEKYLADSNSFLKYNVNFCLGVQNSAVDLEYNYNDKFNISLAPSIYGRATKNVSFYIRGLIENAKYQVIDARKKYYGDEQGGLWGGFEVSKIMYNSKHFDLKFGRDYFMPGMSFNESIIFSKEQSTYDQLYLAYRNDWMNISSFVLKLDDINNNNRFLNGHRLTLNLNDKGYLGIGELLLYYGNERPMEYFALNPFLIYYLYQRNYNIKNTNSMIFAEVFYNLNDYFIHGEFILDDFQVDNVTYGDMEPTEYGVNITIGKNNIVNGLNFNINYTSISNRTYSAPNRNEYYIYQNLPIGHFMGSNLWEMKSNISYINKKYQGEIQFIYREYGDDVVYSNFNYDYLEGNDYSDLIPEGHSYIEKFPYVSNGEIPNIFWGLKSEHYFQLLNFAGLYIKASYWIEKGMLSSNFNIAGGFYFNF